MKRVERDARCRVSLTLNGAPRSGWCDSRTLLSDFLRQELGATGTHVGCEHGVCGACTVHVDGTAVRSCLMLAVQADGHSVDTVEGIAGTEGLNALQRAFKRHHALQCGYCTPGILMSATQFLEQMPHPSERQVREMLSGHLCRCTGYTSIVHAILDAAVDRRAPAPDA
jgi:2-furoyl-CoA dehydrogenase 2Fe-2S iron sulfur subunit